MKLIAGRTTAATGPKNALVTRIESAPVSGAVIRNDMQEERDAPLRRISATTGTTEQLHSGIGTPMAALEATDFRLSRRSHFRTASREIKTWISPARNRPRRSIGPSSRNEDQRKSKKRTKFSTTLSRAVCTGKSALCRDGGSDVNYCCARTVAFFENNKVFGIIQNMGCGIAIHFSRFSKKIIYYKFLFRKRAND